MQSGGGPVRLLVADDPVLRPVAEFVMEALPVSDVVSVETAEDALRELRSRRFDLAVAADRLEGSSGVELVRRASIERPWLRFLLVTGGGEDDLTVDALGAGAADCIAEVEDWKLSLGPAIQGLLDGATPDRAERLAALAEVETIGRRLGPVLEEVAAHAPLALAADGVAVWVAAETSLRSAASGTGMPRDPGALAALLPGELLHPGEAIAAEDDRSPHDPAPWPGAFRHLVGARVFTGELTVSVAAGRGWKCWGEGGVADARALAAWLARIAAEVLGREREDEGAGGDAATGLANEAALRAMLADEAARAATPGYRAGLVEARIEAVGEEELRRAGAALTGCLRRYDFAARSGAQGFTVLLPRADFNQSIAVAGRVQRVLNEATGGQVHVGVAGYPASVTGFDFLRRAAHDALACSIETGEPVVSAAGSGGDGALAVTEDSGR